MHDTWEIAHTEARTLSPASALDTSWLQLEVPTGLEVASGGACMPEFISSLATQHRHDPLRGGPWSLCVDASLRVAPGWNAFLPHRAVLPAWLQLQCRHEADRHVHERLCTHGAWYNVHMIVQRCQNAVQHRKRMRSLANNCRAQ